MTAAVSVGRVKKARCGEGIGSRCHFFSTLTYFQLPGPGDPTLKGTSVQREPPNILLSTSRSHCVAELQFLFWFFLSAI